jgi:hypothetical protein
MGPKANQEKYFAFFELQTVQPVASRYTDYATPVPEKDY